VQLSQDLRQGLRLLSKSPAFTAVAVIVLALGIGINTAIFSVVNVLLLRPLTGVRAGQLVGIYSRDRTKAGAYRAFSYPDYRDLREGNDAFNSVLAHNFSLLGLRDGDATRRIFPDVVSSSYFSTLGVHLAQGRAFSPEEEAPGADIPVVVVSEGEGHELGEVVGVVPGLRRDLFDREAVPTSTFPSGPTTSRA
jgi:macrolide transport system ATP-binding/permease protein